MDNIFDVIKNNSAAPNKKDLELLNNLDTPANATASTGDNLKNMSVKSLVSAWKNNPTPEYTNAVLQRMQPTITAAINSYAPNTGEKFSIRAAKLTLDALKAYDPKYGAEPSTYVFNNLKRLNRISGQANNIIKQSEARSLAKAHLLEIANRFEDEHNREASEAELADLTGLSRKKIESLLDDNSIVSESATLTDSGKSTLFSKDIDDNDCFEYVYMSVGPIDQKIMEWTAGKHGKPVLSNNQIAAKLHVSAAAVSQRKNKINQMLSDVSSLI